jgi:hypothetical protein
MKQEIITAKYDRDLVCNLIVEAMKQGAFPKQVSAGLGVKHSTLLQWAREHAECNEALEFGVTLCEAYWLKQAHDGALGYIKPNTDLFKFLTSNQLAGWSDKKEIVNKHEVAVKTLSNEELQKLIDQGFEDYAKMRGLPEEHILDGVYEVPESK